MYNLLLDRHHTCAKSVPGIIPPFVIAHLQLIVAAVEALWMERDLAGMVLGGLRIIVTGAASGIGKATAELLRDSGATVAWLDRDGARLADAAPSDAIQLVADQTDREQVVSAVGEATSSMQGIDCVVNAAGIADSNAASEIGLDRWNQVLAVNLTGPFLICQAAYPWLRQSSNAAIVNVASASGLLPSGAATVYAASKGGLIAATKALAAEWAPSIRVNAVCPGTVDTPMVAGLFEKNEEFFAKMEKTYALRRMASAREIAEAIKFLVSPCSSFITGVSLAVDGGRTFH